MSQIYELATNRENGNKGPSSINCDAADRLEHAVKLLQIKVYSTILKHLFQ